MSENSYINYTCMITYNEQFTSPKVKTSIRQATVLSLNSDNSPQCTQLHFTLVYIIFPRVCIL